MLSAAALAALILAQPQRPLPADAPGELVARSSRVSVVVDDRLDPDRLRDLARAGVTLWLRTSSNTLRSSTLENLGRFDEAWVQLHAPLEASALAPLLALPKVGAWVDASELPALGRRLPRRLAVRVSGPLDELTAQRITAARPSIVSWQPGQRLSVLQWSLLRALPGRKILVAGAEALLPQDCAAGPPGTVALELDVALLLTLNARLFPCGGTRVVVPVSVDRWLVQSLVVREPSVELVLNLGADEAKAASARALLDALGRGPPR